MKLAAVVLATTLVLAGCGGSDADGPDEGARPTATTSTPTESEAPAQDEGVAVDVTIEDGTVTPQGDRVEVSVGEPVTLNVTTDVADEIHVHSDPEHSFEVEGGDAKSFTFTVDTPGQVAVESHHADVTIVQLVVRP